MWFVVDHNVDKFVKSHHLRICVIYQCHLRTLFFKFVLLFLLFFLWTVFDIQQLFHFHFWIEWRSSVDIIIVFSWIKLHYCSKRFTYLFHDDEKFKRFKIWNWKTGCANIGKYFWFYFHLLEFRLYLNENYCNKYVIQQELENENRELRMSLDKYKVLFNRQDSSPGKFGETRKSK